MSALRISVAGQPTRFVAEPEPHLTSRQRQILETVRAYCGNRSRAARALGINVAGVQASLRVAAAAGALVPPGVTRRGIPNGSQRPLGARCALPMREGRCGRREGHPGGCVSVRAWQRVRAA